MNRFNPVPLIFSCRERRVNKGPRVWSELKDHQ